MVYNGAANETQKAIANTLQLQAIDIKHLNYANQKLINDLPNADSAVKLDIANSIWYRQTLQPVPSFLKTTKVYYQAEVKAAAFNDPGTVNKINNWAAEHTNQKIKSIIDRIDPADVMYLINAVYFNGKWKNSFDPKLTKNRDFHTATGQTKQVPFMYREAKYNYGHNDSLQIIELPYGKGKFSMYVLLPAENIKLSSFITSLNEEKLSALLNAMDSSKVKLYLPKWKDSYKIEDLKPELSRMGMGVAFSDQADFSNLFKQHQTKISQVIHKTFIEVNEQGTEAAAVTSTGVRLTSLPLNQQVMDVNRPFIYFIAAKDSGAILFMGEVNDPDEV
jgi:serpin B